MCIFGKAHIFLKSLLSMHLDQVMVACGTAAQFLIVNIEVVDLIPTWGNQ